MASFSPGHGSGLFNAGSYIQAGHPYITGSTDIDNGVEDRVQFPLVARSVTVINRSAVDLRVHFVSATNAGGYTGPNGETPGGNAKVITGLHYVTLTEIKDSITFNVKCREIYITSQGNDGAYEVFAELTGIQTYDMYVLTGSGVTA